MRIRRIVTAGWVVTGLAAAAAAQTAPSNPTINLGRAAGSIKVDGDLSDEGWRNAARVGQDIDFDNARPAHGLTMNLQATLQPTAHLAINFLQNTRSLHVDVFNQRDRLFVERVSRVNSTFMFTSGIFVRTIGQYVSATRDQVL